MIRSCLHLGTCLLLPLALNGPGDRVIAEELEWIDGSRGQVPIVVPDELDDSQPRPLVLWLHGFAGSGLEQEPYFNLRSEVDERGFLLCLPDGTKDLAGTRFWNATDACCDLADLEPDDSGYLRGLIETIIADYPVDLDRIHVSGWSNGGFMSYRMACDHADLVASIATLAGSTFLDVTQCTPSEPVHVLQLHGTLDDVIAYEGGCYDGCHPSAPETVRIWAQYNGCDLTQTVDENMDVDAGVVGDETEVIRYEQSCDSGGSSELWTLNFGGHEPLLVDWFSTLILDWMFEHPKPSVVTCPADFNADGRVDGTDLSLIIGFWGQQNEDYDLDGDGVIGGGDLAFLLGGWGLC
jgi:polyhydroxybutyrate depolymerase